MENMSNTAQQQQERFPLLLIDGDTIPYIIGWRFREVLTLDALDEMYEALERWMQDLSTLTGASAYRLYIGNDASAYFRTELYHYQPYKGTRVKEDWIKFWEPHIRARMIAAHKAVCAPHYLETDDMLSIAGENLAEQYIVYASCDKDMKQLSGYHLDYRTLGMETFRGIQEVSETQAKKNFWMQMLTGDTVDNIAGVPGMGPVKADKLLDCDEMEWEWKVKSAYQKYFGPYYGQVIYDETYLTVKLMTSRHPLMGQFYPSVQQQKVLFLR